LENTILDREDCLLDGLGHTFEANLLAILIREQHGDLLAVPVGDDRADGQRRENDGSRFGCCGNVGEVADRTRQRSSGGCSHEARREHDDRVSDPPGRAGPALHRT
jgi:hypothetical protein